MNNKNIIIAGAIAIGLYLFSQGKTIVSAYDAQKRIAQPTPHITQQEAARKRAVAERIAQKVAQKRIGQPITRTAYIAATRKAAAQKAVPQIPVKTGGRTGMALVIYLQKQAKAMHAQLIQAANAVKNKSKIILPSSKWSGGRTGMALVIYLKSREVAIAQALSQAKAAVPITKLFPGAEKSRVIPYKESSKHSYYGPKSHKLQNEGYMVEWQKRHNNSIEAYNDRKLQYVLSHPKYWKK